MINIILALAVGTIILYLVYHTADPERVLDSKLEKRLVDIKKKKFLSESKESLNLANALFQETEYKIKFLGEFFSKLEFAAKIEKKLKLVDLNIPFDIFMISPVLILVFFMLVAFFVPAIFFGSILLGFILAAAPFVFLDIKIKQRIDNFTKQFPDALDLIAASLKAGHSLQAAFQVVVSEMPKPICDVFKIAVDEISLGLDVKDALDNMSESVFESIDLRFFVTAVLVQREIGGNLTEILDKLNITIRERFKVKGQLQAQTAQARLSGMILAAAPIFIVLIISMLNPGYLDPLFQKEIGKTIVSAAVMMEILGFFIIQKITNIRV